MSEPDRTPDLSPAEEAALDAAFAELAAETLEPSPDLMARILADAEAVQDHAASDVVVTAPADRPGFLSSLWASFGGAAGFTSLVTATLAGLWLGYSPPESLGDWSATLLGSETDLAGVDDFGLGLNAGLFDTIEDEIEG